MTTFPCHVCRYLHFTKINNICHFVDHLNNVLMSSCNLCLSPISLVFLNSCHLKISIFCLLPLPLESKSLMYTNNKIGPSTDPCGTPLNTDFQIETSPYTTTLCFLSVSHCSIQLIILFSIPCAFNLSISL